MDESWDADFDGDLKVPATVRGASQSVKTEITAAKQLAAVTRRLRELLLQNPAGVDRELMVRAMAIVHASVTDETDALYRSPAWDTYRHGNLEVAGDSIEDVLGEATAVLDRLQQEVRT